MPLHVVTLTVPANTPQYTPARVELKPGAFDLTRIGILFPNGCLGAVGVRISLRGVQFAPVTGWLYGNGEVVTWDENRSLGADPLIVCEGYSDAEDWPHSLQIRFFFK